MSPLNQNKLERSGNSPFRRLIHARVCVLFLIQISVLHFFCRTHKNTVTCSIHTHLQSPVNNQGTQPQCGYLGRNGRVDDGRGTKG